MPGRSRGSPVRRLDCLQVGGTRSAQRCPKDRKQRRGSPNQRREAEEHQDHICGEENRRSATERMQVKVAGKRDRRQREQRIRELLQRRKGPVDRLRVDGRVHGIAGKEGRQIQNAHSATPTPVSVASRSTVRADQRSRSKLPTRSQS